MGRDDTTSEPLRVAMIGGGQGSFMGPVHRLAMTMAGGLRLVAGSFSPRAESNAATGQDLGLAEARIYADTPALIAGEAERAEGAQAVAIVTPNHLHAEQARACLDAGLDVICEKPLTTRYADAAALVRTSHKKGRHLVVTHTYTGYPMVRHARCLVEEGRIGEVRSVQVEYPQAWLASAIEESGQKQALWRVDPRQAGGGCIGDIGSHAFNIAEFVTGLRVTRIAAELSTSVAGRQVDDNANVLLRFENGAGGALWASQIAHGADNDLRLRVIGSAGTLDWSHAAANDLTFTPAGEATRHLSRGAGAAAGLPLLGDRLPPGHPEGYLEAFATLYRDAAELIRAGRAGREPAAWARFAQTAEEGARAVAFIEACLASSQAEARWTELASKA